MARVSVEIKRLNETLEKLRNMSSAAERGSIRGLMAGGLLLQGRSQREAPVEHGFMRASAFTRKAQNNPDAVEVGYGAAYAIFVHELTGEKLRGQPRPSGLGTYWNPGKSHFLIDPYHESIRDIVNLVKKYAAAEVARGPSP